MLDENNLLLEGNDASEVFDINLDESYYDDSNQDDLRILDNIEINLSKNNLDLTPQAVGVIINNPLPDQVQSNHAILFCLPV